MKSMTFLALVFLGIAVPAFAFAGSVSKSNADTAKGTTQNLR